LAFTQCFINLWQKSAKLSTAALTIQVLMLFFLRKRNSVSGEAGEGHCQKEEFRPQILFENNLKNILISYQFLYHNEDTKSAISSLKNLAQIYGGNSKL
jgi:hypothetical protein